MLGVAADGFRKGVNGRNRDGKPLVVEPVDLPSDFSFKSDPVARAMQEFTITWQAPPTFRGSRTVYISFRDKTDPSGSVTFPIVVHGHD